ncbi:MAG TPA: hypothetical protein VIU93_07785, partial [Gallionellaceae bacterium]
MDKKTVFVKTSKGVGEASSQSDFLYGDAKRVLSLIDDESTVAEITKRAPPSLRSALEGVMQELVDGGFIRDRDGPAPAPQASLKFASPKITTPKVQAPVAAPTPATPAAPARAPA